MLDRLQFWHVRLSLAFIGIMVTVPFLMTYHFLPVPSFYQEWVAVAMGLLAATVLVGSAGKEAWEIPEMALLPFGLIVIAALQWLFQANALSDRLLTLVGLMAWTTLLVILGRHLARGLGMEVLARVIATAILVGALLEAFTGLLQFIGLARMPWVFANKDFGAYGVGGNVAQVNNFANYLWLGVGSAIYLRSRGWLNSVAAAVCLLFLLPVAILSGSRSVWLYAAALAALAWIWTWRQDDPAAKTLRIWATGALAGAVLFQLAFSTGLIPLREGAVTSGSRVSSYSYQDPVRWKLWRVAFDVFLDKPWLGAGFGQYAGEFYLRIFDVVPLPSLEMPEHAHNLLLNLLAELGLLAGLLLVVLGLRWAAGLFRFSRTPEAWWIGACILVLLIHSGLEYPLWYTFFLGIAALLAGAGSQKNYRLPFGRIASATVGILVVVGAFSLYTVQQSNSLLESVYKTQELIRMAPFYRVQAERVLEASRKESLMLRAYADFTAASLMPDNGERLQEKLAVCHRAELVSPNRGFAFKCAHLRVLAGDEEQGVLALRRAVAAFPDHAEMILPEWRRRAWQEPAIARLLAVFPPIPKR